MNYINAIALMELVGFLSIFIIVFVFGIFNDDGFKEFAEKSIENGISLKMLLFIFAVMAIVLTYFKII